MSHLPLYALAFLAPLIATLVLTPLAAGLATRLGHGRPTIRAASTTR